MTGGSVRRALAGAALVTATALASCSYPQPTAASPAQTPSAGASASASPSPAADTRPKGPLTGAPVDPSVVARSAVAVAVTGSSPSGLDKADVVIEEQNSPVRYVGLFQSQDSAQVGPLAQTRPSDIMGLTILRPVYGFRDGPNGMVDQVSRSALVGINSATHSAMYTASGSSLYASTSTLRAGATAPAAKPILVFGDGITGAVAGGKRASSVLVKLPNGQQVWRYDPAKASWRRESGGPAITVKNLIVQVVEYKAVTLSHRYGGSDISAKMFGSGPAYVASGPQAISGKWSKPGLPQQTNFLDAQAVPVRLAPGTTYLILAPTGSAVTSG